MTIAKGAMKEKKAPVDKRSKLKELAQKRVPKALKAISLCGNLSAYAPGPDDIEKIIKALDTAVSNVATRLKGTAKSESGFSL